jgi:hypothetical protein
MRCFLGTNVFVAAILDTDETEATGTATALLYANHEFLTSLLSLICRRWITAELPSHPGVGPNQLGRCVVVHTRDTVPGRVCRYLGQSGCLVVAGSPDDS